MRLIHVLFLSVFVLLGASAPVAIAADRVSIQGILVVASDKPGETDARLAPYEPTLRRILRFESYRSAGEGSTGVGVPGSGNFSLGRGHRIEIETEASGGEQIRARVRWLDGDRVLMNTGLVLKRGVPAVLGGPARSERGEVYAVIIIAS